MKQATFPFDDAPSNPPVIEIDAELEQQLLESMAQAIVDVFQSIEGKEHDPS